MPPRRRRRKPGHRPRRGHRHRDQARREHAGRLAVDQGLRYERHRDARPATDRRRREVHPGPFARAARAGRHDHRVPRRRASPGIQFGAVSSSALYLDEQPITQSGRSPDPRFIDIERIEALRGPQGTLYGASSQSGTLRVITNKPDPSGFGAWAEAEVNSVDGGSEGYDLSAMVNVPLGDRVSLRLVGFTAEDAGYIDNVLAREPGRDLRQRRLSSRRTSTASAPTADARRCASTSAKTWT